MAYALERDACMVEEAVEAHTERPDVSVAQVVAAAPGERALEHLWT